MATKKSNIIKANPPLIQPARSCLTCAAFRIIEGIRDAAEPLDGECHWEPPIYVETLDEETDSIIPVSIWPLVRETDFCIKGYTPKE